MNALSGKINTKNEVAHPMKELLRKSRSILSEIRKCAEFVKISHTIFALPFALAAMVVAARDTHGWPGTHGQRQR
jgi:hypothetical protein